MADDLGEKTEEPTPKRLLEAREEGNVSRSQDLAAALLLGSMSVALWFIVGPMLGGFGTLLQASLDGSTGNAASIESLQEFLRWSGVYAVRYGLPLLLIAWVAGYLVHIWQIGWLFAPKAVQPKFSKLNPISGFKRVFGLSSLVKAGLDSMKVLLVVVVAAVTIISYRDRIVVLPYLTSWQGWVEIGALLFDVSLRVIAVLILLGLLDFMYQKWKHNRDMRMSKQEVKDELKQTEGDPETKRRRMRMQQQIAMQRIGAAVPKADVIVTNPEHISIAIQYDEAAMHAPKVVAKGADFLALRIRQLAMKHQIPIVERKPLARALYAQVAVGQEIPPEFYKAVAEILAYVYQLGGRRAG